MKSSFVTRIRLVILGIFLVTIVLLIKLYSVQIVSGNAFADKANRQYAKPNQTIFERGTIYFQNKDGSKTAAATLKEGYTLAMTPKDLTNAEVAYDKINPLLTIDKATFFSKAAKKDDP